MLTSKQKSYLKSMGNSLELVVLIGKGGITPTVIESTQEALSRELIKVRVLPNSPVEPKDGILELATKTGAEVAQVIGRNGLLYKRNTEKPRIELP